MAYLLIRNEILEDQRVDLDGDALIVGRGQDTQVCIPDRSVSRFHARLERDAGGWRVTDLGSSNGTFVNGARIATAITLEHGDEVRFGSIRTLFETAAPVAAAAPLPVAQPVVPPVAAASYDATTQHDQIAAHGRAPRRGSPQGLIIAGLALVVVGLAGTAIWTMLQDRNEPERASTAYDERDTDRRDDPDGNGGHGQGQDSGSKGTDGGAQDAGPNESRPDAPTPRNPDRGTQPLVDPPKPPPEEVRTVVLTDGTSYQGKVVDDADPLVLYFRPKGSSRRTLALPREKLASLDGSEITVDLQALYDARIKLAESVDELLGVADWCESVGLKENRLKVARMIVEGDRDHLGANAILGRFRYRGKWFQRAELEKTGSLTKDGRLVGSPEDMRAIRRLYLVTVGRTPLRTEVLEALAEDEKATTERLLSSSDHWQAWLAELLVRFLGPESGATLLEQYTDTAEELADGSLSFRDVFVEIANSDAVRVKYASPEAFARRTLEVFIGEQALQDEDLIRNAVKMLAGERVPVMGERGSSREDFLEIISKQAAFYRWQIRYEAARYLGPAANLTSRQLTRGAMRLAMSPANFKTMRRGWLVGPDYKRMAGTPRTKDVGQFVRGLIVDAFNRRPKPVEEGRLRRIAADLSAPDGMRSIIAAIVARSSDLFLDAPASRSAEIWVEDQFRRLIGRVPTAAEAREFVAVAKTPLGPRAVIATLLQSPEYLIY